MRSTRSGHFLRSGSGYLHLVYFIEAEDGAGVFFAHSMDKGEMFHAPVPVVYGNAPSDASVAGNGDSVVVVFEDPNADDAEDWNRSLPFGGPHLRAAGSGDARRCAGRRALGRARSRQDHGVVENPGSIGIAVRRSCRVSRRRPSGAELSYCFDEASPMPLSGRS